MKKLNLTLIGLVAISSVAFAGNGDAGFTPSGKATAKIFTDFSSVTMGSTSTTDSKTNNAFNLSRAYFGYGYSFSPNFSAKVLFDIANNGTATPSNFDAFIKNAYAEYKGDVFTFDLGMIGTTMFNLQESTWGKRYLYQSFQDKYGFGSSADLGFCATAKLAPEASVDLSILNGEGYKSIQTDSTFKVALGLTLKPVKEFVARAYVDYYKKPFGKSKDQTSFNVFAAYTGAKATIGGEFNMQTANKFTTDHNWSGVSFYGTYNASKMVSLFARFDNLTSKNDWSTANDGQTYIAGLEVAPVKGIKISPNFQYFNPKANNVASKTTIGINVEASF